MSKLNKTFTATLQRSPSKGGWTYVVMPGSAQYFKTRGLVKVKGTVDGHPFGAERRGQIMPDVISEVTLEFLQAFADAWNHHDVDALMTFMTDDCVFEASAGPDVCGTRYAGREAVRAGFAEVWATFPDAHWGDARHFVHGGRGVSEWTFTGTRADGTRVEVHGCDLFTFRDGRISLKNSYRKNRAAPGTPKR